MSDSLRVVFAGTPQFSVPALEALSHSRHRLVGAITRPDRPAGRGRQLSESAVSTAARRLGISVSKPPTLRSPDAVSSLTAQAPDVIVVAAYGRLLPDEILRLTPTRLHQYSCFAAAALARRGADSARPARRRCRERDFDHAHGTDP